MKKLTIPFALTECWRCASQRQVCRTCANCGALPKNPEADPALQRRQRAVRDARLAGPAVSWTVYPSPITLFDDTDLVGLISRVWSAARAVAADDANGSTDLASACSEVVALEQWAAGAPRLRPLISLTERMTETIGTFRAYLNGVLEALEADSLEAGQGAAPKVQHGLDSISEAVGRMETLVADIGTVFRAEDPMGALLRLTLRDDPLTTGERGTALLRSRLGGAPTEDEAMLALAGDSFAQIVGDPEVFWAIVRDHLVLLRSDPSMLEPILRLPLLSLREAEVAHDGMSAARRAARLPEAMTDREDVTDLLALGHLVIEQPLKLELGVASALHTRMDLGRTQEADVSELINLARAKGWVVTETLPPSAIRNAFAHRRYALEGQEIVVQPRGGPEVRLSPLELQDAVLSVTEAVMAMALARAIVSTELGVEVSYDVPAVWMAESLMVGVGWSEIHLEVEDRSAYIRARVEVDQSVSTLAMVVHPLLAVADSLVLDLAGPGRAATLRVPLDRFRRWTTVQDEVERSAQFVVLNRMITRDDEPLMTAEAAKKVLAWSAAQAAASAEDTLRPVIRDLRTIRAAARELGYTDLVQMLGRLIQWRSLLSTDTQVEFAEIEEIFEVIAVEVDTPSGMLLDLG